MPRLAFERMLEFTGHEISTLKELANKSAPPWWRNYPFLLGFGLGVFGFILSLSTAMLSVYTNRQKDIHDQQAELATAIRTIQELNLRNMELREKYRGTPDEARAIGFMTNYINSTVLMASDTALRLGRNATTSTVSALSQLLYTSGDFAKAEQLAQLALDVVRGAEDEATAQRILGGMKIRSGDRKEGERLFLLAATIDSRYDLKRLPAKRDWLKAQAHLQWAYALAVIDCDGARKQFIEAITALNFSGSTPDLDRLRADARRAFTLGIAGIRACVPANETPAVEVK